MKERFGGAAARIAYLVRLSQPYLLPISGLLLVGLLTMAAGYYLRHRQPVALPTNRLIVTVLNVGQGEASWIRTPGGRFIVIGSGPPEQKNDLRDSLKAAGATRVDLMVIPYPYAETLGGFSALLNELPVAAAWDTGGKPINTWHRQVHALLSAQGVTARNVRAGDTVTIDGVVLQALAPTDPLLTASPVAANNSVVVRLTYGTTRFLWAGGLERKGEVALLSRMPELSAQWLRVARFASKNASSPEFLRLVAPEIAVVSVGPNRGGYPHPETLARLQATGATIYRTDTQAEPLQFISDGNQITAPGL